MEDMAFDFAGALWSVKKILSAIERASFSVEILILSITALVIVLTIFFAIKIFRTISNSLKPALEKLFGKFSGIKNLIFPKVLDFIEKRRNGKRNLR